MCFECHRVPYCVKLKKACILAQLMYPFAVGQQPAAWPIDVAAVTGRDSCTTTRYGELREETGRKDGRF